MLPNRQTVRAAFLRDWAKVSLLKYRDYDGYFATMHQAGNHWIRHIMAEVLHEVYGAPRMRQLTDVAAIGTPKEPPTIPGMPRMVVSHRICSPLVHARPVRAFRPFPRTVILVRDLRAMLVSHYARYGHTYNGETFSEYLRGDVWGKAHNCDLWDSIRFLNVWGDVQLASPDRVMTLTYEALQADPAGSAQSVWDHFGFKPLDRAVFERAVEASTKEKMAGKQAVSHKIGTVIRTSGGRPEDAFDEADREFLRAATRRHLKHHFGYDYSRWPGAEPGSTRRDNPVDSTAEKSGRNHEAQRNVRSA